MKAIATRKFQATDAAKAAEFMLSVGGSMRQEGDALIVEFALDKKVAGVVAKAAGEYVAAAGVKVAAVASKAGVGTVKVAGAAAKVGIHAAAPIVGATGVVAVQTGAAVINASANAGAQIKQTWKEDASVLEAKQNIKDAVASVRGSVPKVSLFGVSIRF